MCVVVRRRSPALTQPLELVLAPCNETEAWEYSAQQWRLVLRGTAVLLCLHAEGAGRPASLGVSCGDAMARWSLVSDSKLHVAVNATSLAWTSLVRTAERGHEPVPVPERAQNSCDPQGQRFKLVSSTRSVQHVETSMAPRLRARQPSRMTGGPPWAHGRAPPQRHGAGELRNFLILASVGACAGELSPSRGHGELRDFLLLASMGVGAGELALASRRRCRRGDLRPGHRRCGRGRRVRTRVRERG
uniref:Uncharacterized protein n=1 Tax=Saccharum hybrid cultivar R570 TaxID=131158 RepID=A0A059Q1H3_9POAL|nr:hypothetical protein SHCRBa_026_H12_R_120 [Saccharum hybrid cultivar R570]